jgi:hypothetical protein
LQLSSHVHPAVLLMLLSLFPAILYGQTADSGPAIRFGQRVAAGRIDAPRIGESSGLAPSLQFPGLYWTHNDNGRNPGLFLVDLSGSLQATLDPGPLPFRDWEDLASVRLDGMNYLILADVGNNRARHVPCRLYVFEEPRESPPDAESGPAAWVLPPLATLEFRWPGEPCDCEAMFVDAADRKVFMISKSMDASAEKDRSTVHWVPWQTQSTARPVLARRLPSGFDKPMVTGADCSPDGQWLVIRSYTAAWLFRRAGSQQWSDVLQAGQPVARTLLPLQRQGEAVCFSHDGQSLLLTSEGFNQTIWQIGLERSARQR